MLRHSLKFQSARSIAVPSNKLTLVECPRDAMQGLAKFVPTEQKIKYHTALLKCGFDTLDCVSFVNPRAIPQMRDSEEVLSKIGPLVASSGGSCNTKLLAIVANQRGALKAAQSPHVTYLGYPLSASETFQRNNTNRGIDEALSDLAEIQEICEKSGKQQLVSYVSMAFGNPYKDAFSPQIVQQLVDRIVAMNCKTVSLADTVGCGSEELIADVFKSVSSSLPEDVAIGLHLHASTTGAYAKVLAAMDAGCRRFDAAVAGMGGCPHAQSELVGNIPTETIVEAAIKLGLDHGIDLDALAKAKEVCHETWGTSIKELFIAAVLDNERMLLDLCYSTFNEHDTFKVGFLNHDQFISAMRDAYRQLGEGDVSEQKLEQKFAEMDVNHDDRITFDEFMLFSRKALKRRLQKLMHEDH